MMYLLVSQHVSGTEKVMYLLMSQHVSGIIMPIIRRTVQSRQRLWYAALAVLQQTRGEEMVRCALVGIGETMLRHQ
jgi:hypothetical protein